MTTSNKYCPKCSEYNGNDWDFYDKYGELGCSGIPYPTGEFPDDAPPHCFTTEKRLTLEERARKKIQEIKDIMNNNSFDEAVNIIANRYK